MKKILTSTGEYILDDKLIFGVYINSENEILIDKIRYRMLSPITNQRVYSDEELANPPYNYTKVEIDEKYEDCQPCDLNLDLTFNVSKYNSRKEKEKNIELINDYKQKLNDSDYKAIKYAEGLISETDYATIKAERENYRKAINSLEISLK